MPVRTARRRPRLEPLEERWMPAFGGGGGPVFWINPGDGDWNDPESWSSGTVPGPANDVIIGSGVVVTYVNEGGSTVQSLDCDGGLVIAGGSLGLSQTSSIADLTVSGGTLFANGGVTVSDSF